MNYCTGHTVSTIMALDLVGEDWERVELAAEAADVRLKSTIVEVLGKKE